MDQSRDLAGWARSILDANRYMTLGTADRDGTPWVSSRASLPIPEGPSAGDAVLCQREAGQPCAEHGRAFDHRTNVTL